MAVKTVRIRRQAIVSAKNSMYVKPKRFWLICNVSLKYHEEETKQLGLGKLDGLRGVSGRREIVINFFNVARNAAVAMDANKVLQANQLTPVQYHNPHYFLSNGMQALYRIWEKKSDTKWGRQGLIQNLFDYMLPSLKKSQPRAAYTFGYYGYATKVGFVYSEKPVKINTVFDLQKWMLKALKKVDEDTNNSTSTEEGLEKSILDSISEALVRIGQVYQDEGEWMIKNTTFIIPKGSVLLISRDERGAKYYEKERQGKLEPIEDFQFRSAIDSVADIYDAIKKYKLDSYYKIKFIDPMHYRDIRNRVLQRRQNK